MISSAAKRSGAALLAALLAVGCAGFRAGDGAPAPTTAPDAAAPTTATDAAGEPVGELSGGPCASGEKGSTGFRVSWEDDKTRAVAKVEEIGLPDPKSFSIVARELDGTVPGFGDPYLGPGGVDVGSSAYVDIELSTRGLGDITSATLSVLGRSYDTTESGSFSWQTSLGTGKVNPATISNGVPYEWSSADITPQLPLDDPKVQLRLRPGPPSMKLVIQRIELCIRE